MTNQIQALPLSSMPSKSSAHFVISCSTFSNVTNEEEEKSPALGWKKKIESKSMGSVSNFLEVPSQVKTTKPKRKRNNTKEVKQWTNRKEPETRAMSVPKANLAKDNI